jgi:MATE family multidrug resistance protein
MLSGLALTVLNSDDKALNPAANGWVGWAPLLAHLSCARGLATLPEAQAMEMVWLPSPSPMFTTPRAFTSASIARQLVSQAWPNLVAQLLAVGMMVADTIITGHYSTADLAGVAIGSSFYVSVIMLLTGTMQAVAPTVAHHVGARRDEAVAGALQQGFWLASALAVPGLLLMFNPEPLLHLASVPAETAQRASDYLSAAALGVPAVLVYRTFTGFSNAVGQPKALMVISALVTACHVPLAWALVHGALLWPPMGGTGCGLSTALVNWLGLLWGALYLVLHKGYARYQLWAQLQGPRWPALCDLLRLGLPIGMSTFIDVSSFTMIAVLAARMGEATVAGHRIISNLTALIYMLPLSLGIATLVHVGQAMGAQDPERARATARMGLRLSLGCALLIGMVLWLLREPVIALYTSDATVRQVALSLVLFLCLYQGLDGLQTVASYALRGYKVTLLPMVIHTVCFWGVGLMGGYWLSFSAPWRAGEPSVQGFWQACVAATVLASVLFVTLLRRVAQARLPVVEAGSPGDALAPVVEELRAR